MNHIPDYLQDTLLAKLHEYDRRLYFLLSTNATPREFIVSADGNSAAFDSVDALVDAAPRLDDWTFISLKPPQGFAFTHSDGPISIDVSQLRFALTKSKETPPRFGVILYIPNIDFVLEHQSVDTAYTILETGVGERRCTDVIARLTVDDPPGDLTGHPSLPIARLSDWLASQTGG
ncbi:hypothetical protein SAMN06265222_1369 [Neorhodopirellula lusitana]|uniref:Uncharacterized protein n=2 Tax=Neorhodopirellula lusitana TaxID=445327 RepID=A0ABY1QUV5_9BACT|nr:hypothetical protein SAMN06265222_1369 [Neorhodopirellula lusitana]